jgi:hypothetical protein
VNVCAPACQDADGDGFTAPACGGTDCDDQNASVHPWATEVCGDGVDNDCNGIIDDLDRDGDGYIDKMCIGFNGPGGDCWDTNDSVHPSAPEVCGDGVDNDCSGVIDDGCP